jgi:hypothetical protein
VRRKLDWELYLLKSNDGNKLRTGSYLVYNKLHTQQKAKLI